MGIEVLRRVREDAGLSGAEAARRIGVSRSTLWRAERGVSRASRLGSASLSTTAFAQAMFGLGPEN
jgi:transcriptional regulator with XRE-family HTH domain